MERFNQLKILNFEIFDKGVHNFGGSDNDLIQ